MAEVQNIDEARVRQRLNRLVGEWAQGRTSIKEIAGISDEELYSLSIQGYYLFLQGRFQSAQILFEGLVAIDPRNAYNYRALGAIYWRLKEPQKALRQLTYAIRVSPTELSAYVNRAEIYVSLREVQNARSDLRYILSSVDPNVESLRQKARALLSMID